MYQKYPWRKPGKAKPKTKRWPARFTQNQRESSYVSTQWKIKESTHFSMQWDPTFLEFAHGCGAAVFMEKIRCVEDAWYSHCAHRWQIYVGKVRGHSHILGWPWLSEFQVRTCEEVLANILELPDMRAPVRQTYGLVSKWIFEEGEVGERGNFKCSVLRKTLKQSSQNVFKHLEKQK